MKQIDGLTQVGPYTERQAEPETLLYDIAYSN